MKNKEIRYANARTLLKECRTLAELSRKLGKAYSYISAIAGDKPTKKIGDAMAEHMEKTFNKPPGWMDKEHPEQGKDSRKASIASKLDLLDEEQVKILEALIDAQIASKPQIQNIPTPAIDDTDNQSIA